jgi:phospholipase C
MGIEDIKHVVILMQENRSFDEYFGTFPGVSGFSDDSPLFRNPWPGSNFFPFRLSTFTAQGEKCPGCNHDWNAMHADYAQGHMNGWNTQGNPSAVLGFYVADDIPYHWALAQTFALCDHYFCSVLGGTCPNRLYLMSGAIRDISPNAAGRPGAGPFVYNPGQGGDPDPLNASWRSYPDALTSKGILWTVYDETNHPPPWLEEPPAPTNGWGPLNVLDQFQNWPTYEGGPHIKTNYVQFEADVAAGNLPAVSWLVPPFGVTEWEVNHPADGACYISQKLDALLNSPLWDSTVFILTYDENDGHFDHVLPPIAPANAVQPEQEVNGEPIGAGFRVPAIIISPWTVGVGVRTDYFDHTSILQFLEKVTGVACPNLPPGGFRRQTFGDLTTVFNFANPVAASAVIQMLPSFSTAIQWNSNAQARLVGKPPVAPPQPQPNWPPVAQSCAVNSLSFSYDDVIREMNMENSGEAPQPGPSGSATMANVLIVNVYGFEPDEFVDKDGGAPRWVPQSIQNPAVPQVPVQGGGMCDTRVPSVTVTSGGSPGEFSFNCTQVSVDPNALVAAAQPGAPQLITFWISITFNRTITSFGFRKGMVRTIGLCISFTVDTTVTVTGEMKLTGGTLIVEPLGACAELAEQISQAERTLLNAQRVPEEPGSAETIAALEKALTALQNQYNRYCGSGGSSGPSRAGGHVHLGGG